MVKIHSTIIPAVLLGIVLILLAISLISPTESVSAGTQFPNETTGQDASLSSHPVFVDQLPSQNEQSAVQVTIVDQPDSAGQNFDVTAYPEDCPLSPDYPASIQQWCNLIQQVATDFELDANLIAAVMLQESGGDPQAYSKSGAVGLMQVMPRDGIAAKFMCINGPCFSSRPASEELFDPTFNLQYGVRMLVGLSNKYGNVRDALKAYGPMDVGFSYADKVLAIYENYQ